MDRFRERTGRRRLIGRLPAGSFPVLFTPGDAEGFVRDVRRRVHQQTGSGRCACSGLPTVINFGECTFHALGCIEGKRKGRALCPRSLANVSRFSFLVLNIQNNPHGRSKI